MGFRAFVVFLVISASSHSSIELLLLLICSTRRCASELTNELSPPCRRALVLGIRGGPPLPTIPNPATINYGHGWALQSQIQEPTTAFELTEPPQRPSQPPPQTTPTTTPPPPSGLPPDIWIYIGIGLGAAVLLISQTICFCLYIQKLKSSTLRRSINNMTLIPPNDNNSEDRYQRAPSRVLGNVPKTTEQHHTSSLYEYECVKDITDKKPEPPPTSTLPKRNRPPLPLPNNIQGPKASNLTSHSTQQLLQQRGRQVSTVPNKSPVNFNPHAAMPSRSPSTRRLPTNVPTPVLKPREPTRNDRSHMIYESLPDLREYRYNQKPPVVHPPLTFTPPTPSITPDLNRARRLHRETPSPLLSKPRMPLPQEYNRNDQGKPSIATPAPPNYLHAVPSHQSSNFNRPRRNTDNDAVSSELMEKLKRRANLNSQGCRTAALPKKPPVRPPSKVAPKPKYIDESSDEEEWTIEEIKQINMYNV